MKQIINDIKEKQETNFKNYFNYLSASIELIKTEMKKIVKNCYIKSLKKNKKGMEEIEIHYKAHIENLLDHKKELQENLVEKSNEVEDLKKDGSIPGKC